MQEVTTDTLVQGAQTLATDTEKNPPPCANAALPSFATDAYDEAHPWQSMSMGAAAHAGVLVGLLLARR